jgi:DNA polymerase I
MTMKMSNFILMDVNYLAWRAHYSTGQLAYMGDTTGVIFGVLKEIQQARERFPDHKFVFCFDHGKGIREEMLPCYKETRRKKKLDDEEVEIWVSFKSQVKKLKTKILGQLGFANVFYQEGYEADDIIAKFCITAQQTLPDKHDIIIYSDDQDLYQLLTPSVTIYKPRTKVSYSFRNFKKMYKIKPKQWAKVKAIAGCKSDDVPGVEGVGETTAIKYLRGELTPGSRLRVRIEEQEEMWRANLPIVRLPLEGCKAPVMSRDTYTDQKWNEVIEEYAMNTLRGMPGGIDKPKPLLKV